MDTPGYSPKDDLDLLDHPYYKYSMKIIELLLKGRDGQILVQQLDTPVYLNKVFYEESLPEST